MEPKMWDPVDFENPTDEQKRLGAHPEISWVLVIFFGVAFAFGGVAFMASRMADRDVAERIILKADGKECRTRTKLHLDQEHPDEFDAVSVEFSPNCMR